MKKVIELPYDVDDYVVVDLDAMGLSYSTPKALCKVIEVARRKHPEWTNGKAKMVVNTRLVLEFPGGGTIMVEDHLWDKVLSDPV